jgi:L,D-transpeptidase ErfK/SrfK
LALTIGSIGIHGTNAPGSVYQATTHGCIRVHPDDMQVLFDRVGVGTTGDFVYEPVLLTTEGTDVFLEVHPDIYRRQRPAGVVARELADRMRITHLIDWTQADLVVAQHHGIARCVTRQH